MVEQTTMTVAKVSHYEHDDAFIFRQNQGISVCPISAPHRLPGARQVRCRLKISVGLECSTPAVSNQPFVGGGQQFQVFRQ